MHINKYAYSAYLSIIWIDIIFIMQMKINRLREKRYSIWGHIVTADVAIT
jgi:hypothetical protein